MLRKLRQHIIFVRGDNPQDFPPMMEARVGPAFTRVRDEPWVLGGKAVGNEQLGRLQFILFEIDFE